MVLLPVGLIQHNNPSGSMPPAREFALHFKENKMTQHKQADSALIIDCYDAHEISQKIETS